MSSSQQLQYIQSLAEFPPAVLALCADAVRLKRLAAFLLTLAAQSREEAKQSDIPPFRRVNGAQLSRQGWTEIRDSLLSFSLFSRSSLFLIEEVSKLSSDIIKELAELIPDLPSSSKLVLSASELPASNALRKMLASKKWVVQLEELHGAELKRWIHKELKSAKFESCDSVVPDLLSEMADRSPDKIAGIVELLSLYCGGGALKENDIRSLFPDRVQANEFHLLDCVISGNESGTLQELARLKNSGKSPLALLGLLNKNLSTIASIRVLQARGLPASEIRERIGVPEWLYRKHAGSASRVSLDSVRRIFSALLRADSKFKNYSLEETEVFSELFEALAAQK